MRGYLEDFPLVSRDADQKPTLSTSGLFAYLSSIATVRDLLLHGTVEVVKDN